MTGTVRVFADPRLSREELMAVISNPDYQKKATEALKNMPPGSTYVDPQHPMISVQLFPDT